ncbi:DNA-cytosine methyltransferase [Pseudomonas syringae pv. avellanae str. ISPaVe013]|uniref:DNA cytosine methyltransferase n=1 Tax=Pseudomonas syringae TaxID=317 RepID=UPI00028C9AE6|nr:DNA cytosine methyltransferase [Pseudomonas syringae]EKG36689.1 DNA-cytosine methyltransferase [Pseudomonas syringae pv. avellanae str. ISPaVe013]
MRFIDVFAGCGGLSLGLLKSNWDGVVAIEKNPAAFETLRHNLIQGKRYKFKWPDWLPVSHMSCEGFLEQYGNNITSLSGTVDLMVGGPPCQGFSTAGRRNPDDPRNKMAEQYLELVKRIMPSFIVIENVSGFNSKFSESKRSGSTEDRYFTQSYADFICLSLEKIGYTVSRGKVNCADFGVPQNRRRYLIMCSLKDSSNLFDELIDFAGQFKTLKGLRPNSFVSTQEALGDLETTGKILKANTDSEKNGFKELSYKIVRRPGAYLKLMRDDFVGAPDSMRIPNHKDQTVMQFGRIREASEPGKSLSKAAREKLGLKKHALTVLSRLDLSPTVTTLPDDIVHYSENRILTARETARLQSFPDWFEFKGKYTTGGKARKVDCPRYTQIGNAVPPLLAEAIGSLIATKINGDLASPEVIQSYFV